MNPTRQHLSGRARSGTLAAVLAAAVVLIAGCGSTDDTGAAGSASQTTVVHPSTALTPTTPPPSVPVSSAPETAVEVTPVETEPAPATTDAPAATTAAPTAIPYVGGVPCCDTNWMVPEPSPELPAEGAPLADGFYHASLTAPWDSTNPSALQLVVDRFVACSTAPDLCTDTSVGPEDVGVDGTASRPVSFPLDDTSHVVVLSAGTCGDTVPADGDPALQQVTGAGLPAFLGDLRTAYETITAAFPDQDVYEIAPQLASDALPGFRDTGACRWGVQWVPADGGPPVLFEHLRAGDDQTAPPIIDVPGFPPDVLAPTVLWVHDGGQMTLYTFAAFVS